MLTLTFFCGPPIDLNLRNSQDFAVQWHDKIDLIWNGKGYLSKKRGWNCARIFRYIDCR